MRPSISLNFSLDIDSDTPSAFDEIDEVNLRRVNKNFRQGNGGRAIGTF